MSYRKFTDRDGNVWEVRDESRSRWTFAPVSGNPGSPKSVNPPNYETDPFELSQSEVERLFDSVRSARSGPSKSPFLD